MHVFYSSVRVGREGLMSALGSSRTKWQQGFLGAAPGGQSALRAGLELTAGSQAPSKASPFALYGGAFCCRDVERFSLCLCPARCSRKLAGPKGRKRIGWMEFRLFHYAGEVTYCTKGECPGHRSPPGGASVSSEEMLHVHPGVPSPKA